MSPQPAAAGRAPRRALPVRPPAEVLLAAPRGFCAGVRRAIDAVRGALRRHGAPVYVRHAIVHNEMVVRELEAEGAVFVEELDEIPAGQVVVFSAHGVSPAVAAEAASRGLTVYDAVCPLVSRVHRQVDKHRRDGRHVLLIGHAGHPEIVGTLGRLPPGGATLIRSAEEVRSLPDSPPGSVAYSVQTTFSVDEATSIVGALERRFTDVAGASTADICYATTNRQAAVREISTQADAVIVAGSHSSSNANRLKDIAGERCASVQLVSTVDELDWDLLPSARGRIGLTAAASTPEQAVGEILGVLGMRYDLVVRELEGAPETVRFPPLDLGS